LRVQASITAKVRLVIGGGTLILDLLAVSASRFAAAGFDDSAIMPIALSGNLTLNIFIILVLAVLLILTWSNIFRALWLNYTIC